MLNKLLLISGLLCLLIASRVQAQQFKVVAETDEFTDYEFINDELKILSPYELSVPVQNGVPQYRIIEQAVVDVPQSISDIKAQVLVLSDINQPLIQASEPANDRGRIISSISINIARPGDNQVKVLRRLRLRIYKDGDDVTPPAAAKIVTTHPLSSGVWYKIPVTKNGIYELDTDYLSELGIEVNSIDPRDIQIWGTNGYPLAENNSAPRPDFVQIPIIVQGESDGAFNAGDRVLFYGNSPHRVVKNGDGFVHELHPYSNKNFVFLTIGTENGARLSPANNGISPSRTITTFTDFIWKDEELYKSEEKIKSGRYWLGQRFEATTDGAIITVLRDTLPGLAQNSEIQIGGRFAGRSTNSNSFDVFLNDAGVTTINIDTISDYNESTDHSARAETFRETIITNIQNDIIEVKARFNHNESNSTGFVDWIRIQLQRELMAENNRLYFYSPLDGSAVETAQYRLSGFSDEPIALDVTDATNPKLLSVTQSGSDYSVNYFSGESLQFIAQSNFFTPAAGKQIETPNLHGIAKYPDYIIITTSQFKQYADELAAYRANDGLTPVVVTQEHILNEFSGGVLDPSAIRDYVKFLYDRALANGQTLPRYLLLFGDTTFDYKNIDGGGFTNYIATYQSKESLERGMTFATDDFFGFLNEGEGDLGNGTTGTDELIDIGIGRISAQTRAEAATAVQKIKTYENPDNTGKWQNIFTFAADDDHPKESEADLHVLNADGTANRMNILEPGIRLNKVYEFAYPVEITGSGRQIPGATNDFIGSLNNGTLVLNYSGHGNEQTLSDENLFTSDYIPMLTNKDKLAVLVTATCQFGRYDDNEAQSGAEKLFFADNGGVVASFTTTRVVWTGRTISHSNNYGLNIALSQHMLEQNDDGSPLRLGDIFRNTKNAKIGGFSVVSSRNSKKFILIGDPATKFRLPEHRVSLNTLNDYTEMSEDTVLTIRALDQVTLSGQITDSDDNPLPGFSGEADIMVFDAPREVSLPTNREWVVEESCKLDDCSYEVENEILFKGKASVQNGTFMSTFIIPKDISFSDESGRIVFFADDNGTTAGGSFHKIKFNGVNPNAVDDGKGPQMDVFLNDERFVNGNLVNSSPTLIIELEDQSGINTTGTGVGHEIIATIDTEPKQSVVLNEFYEGNLNDYTRGRIEYPLDQLPEGSYTLKVRAWDVHNNPSEQEIYFEVASGEELVIRNVYNFPNPMSNATRFTFEHNQPGTPLDVSIRIYTLSGKPVQHLKEELITTSSYASISWDGRDRDYDRLGNGTYIYVLRVTANTPKGRETTEKIEKLVIIR